jgi:DMSO/TMAO reductase YedYZ heme-binding membrane subunit
MTVGVLWLVSRAAGLVALVLLTATLVAGTLATAPTRSRAWPRWARQTLHRNLALLAVGALAVHVLSVILDSYVDIGWAAAVVPLASGYKPVAVAAGTLALDTILVVVATSLLRVRLGFRSWRAVHWTVYGAWPLAVLHYLVTGTDARAWWGVTLAVVAIGVVGAAVAVRVTAARAGAPAPSPVAPVAPAGPASAVGPVAGRPATRAGAGPAGGAGSAAWARPVGGPR